MTARAIIALTAAPDATVGFVHQTPTAALSAAETIKPSVVVQIGQSYVVLPGDILVTLLRECR